MNVAKSVLSINRILLPSGDALSSIEAHSIMRNNYTKVVAIADSAGSGKTTLVTSIFQKFMKESFAGYRFSGSKTLVGFEQRCHLARISSHMEHQNTERTHPSSQEIFLHLNLCDSKQTHTDVLFSDISGEVFKVLKDSVDDCSKNELLKRADHLVLLIDGEKLMDAGERHKEKIQAEVFLRCCSDAGHLNGIRHIHIVISKLDLIESDAQKKTHLEFMNILKNSIMLRHKDNIENFYFYKIAARAEYGDYDICHGVAPLLKRCANLFKSYSLQSYDITVSDDKFNSEFDKFHHRHFNSI